MLFIYLGNDLKVGPSPLTLRRPIAALLSNEHVYNNKGQSKREVQSAEIFLISYLENIAVYDLHNVKYRNLIQIYATAKLNLEKKECHITNNGTDNRTFTKYDKCP